MAGHKCKYEKNEKGNVSNEVSATLQSFNFLNLLSKSKEISQLHSEETVQTVKSKMRRVKQEAWFKSRENLLPTKRRNYIAG